MVVKPEVVYTLPLEKLYVRENRGGEAVRIVGKGGRAKVQAANVLGSLSLLMKYIPFGPATVVARSHKINPVVGWLVTNFSQKLL